VSSPSSTSEAFINGARIEPALAGSALAERTMQGQTVAAPGAAGETPTGTSPIRRYPVLAPTPATLQQVLAAADKLAAATDLDTLLRGAVSVLRDVIGLERAAIYLNDESQTELRGTFGTGLMRETTDERVLSYPFGSSPQEAHRRAASGGSRWMRLERAPHVAHLEGGTVVIGYGWVVLTPIRSRRGAVGLMFNDAALTHAGLDESRQALAAVFGSVLGHLIQNHLDLDARRTRAAWAGGESAKRNPERPPRAEEDRSSGVMLAGAFVSPARHAPISDSDPLSRSASPLSGLPAMRETHHPVVLRVIASLQESPQLTGETLSLQVGLSDGHLARLFKSCTGLSLVQYRNRLRLERFFAIVGQADGNLLEAAMKAGFGSYAQFHRVFRATLGASPREYLSSRSAAWLEVS
jgi:AraC-like DNA-binding protein